MSFAAVGRIRRSCRRHCGRLRWPIFMLTFSLCQSKRPASRANGSLFWFGPLGSNWLGFPSRRVRRSPSTVADGAEVRPRTPRRPHVLLAINDLAPRKRPSYSALRRYRRSSEDGAFTEEGLHVRVQAGGGSASGVGPEGCGGGAVTGRGRADVVELDQGAQVGQADGQRTRLEVDGRADRDSSVAGGAGTSQDGARHTGKAAAYFSRGQR